GGIETTAETDLEDNRVGRMFRKEHERHGREDFEDGDRFSSVGLGGAFDRAGQKGVVNQPAAALMRQPVALVPADQMRRGMDMDAVARLLQQGTGKGCGGSLSVGARDMNDRRKPALGIAQAIQKPRYAAQRQIVALGM